MLMDLMGGYGAVVNHVFFLFVSSSGGGILGFDGMLGLGTSINWMEELVFVQ